MKYPSTSQTREAMTPRPPIGFSSEWLVNMGGPIPRHRGNDEKAVAMVVLAPDEELSGAALEGRG